MNKQNQQIVIIQVENKPGVLSKVASLCRRRRYNIQSLTVGTTHVPGVSQITLVFAKEKERIHNIVNQIDKLIEVLSVEMVRRKDVADKELVLLVVKNKSVANKLLKNTMHNTNIHTINTVAGHPVLEIVGEGGEVGHLLGLLDLKKDVVKMVRSGLVVLKL